MGIADRRVQYETAGLDVGHLDAHPMRQLAEWYRLAEEAGVAEPNAMTLVTIGPDGSPDARVVLARGLDDEGIVFYTNHESAKGRQLSRCHEVAAVFAWLDLHRQVRVRGVARRVEDSVSDAYFAGRPRESQLGAWASPQSQVIETRGELDRRLAEVTARFAGGDVPRPPHWGGYLIRPGSVEFWQGRPSRLHDRFLYSRTDDDWVVSRLAP